jgi:hypothetical protein
MKPKDDYEKEKYQNATMIITNPNQNIIQKWNIYC